MQPRTRDDTRRQSNAAAHRAPANARGERKIVVPTVLNLAWFRQLFADLPPVKIATLLRSAETPPSVLRPFFVRYEQHIQDELNEHGPAHATRPHSGKTTNLALVACTDIVPGPCSSAPNYAQSWFVYRHKVAVSGLDRCNEDHCTDSETFKHDLRLMIAAAKLGLDVGSCRPRMELWHSQYGAGGGMVNNNRKSTICATTPFAFLIPTLAMALHGERESNRDRASRRYHHRDALIRFYVLRTAFLQEVDAIRAETGVLWDSIDVMHLRLLFDELTDCMLALCKQIERATGASAPSHTSLYPSISSRRTQIKTSTSSV